MSAEQPSADRARVIARNFYAAYTWFHRHDPVLDLVRVGPLVCARAPYPLVDYNVALPAVWAGDAPNVAPDVVSDAVPQLPGTAQLAGASLLQAVTRVFHDQGHDMSLWLGPEPCAARPDPVPTADLADVTRHMGQSVTLDADFAARVAAVPVGALEVRRVRCLEDVTACARLIGAGWDMDATPYAQFFSAQAVRLLEPDCPKALYLGWACGEPVCCMELYDEPEHGVVGVYYVTTLTSARGRGHAQHMQAQVLEQARRKGRHTAVVLSAPGERRLMTRLGFADCGFWREYWMPARMSAQMPTQMLARR